MAEIPQTPNTALQSALAAAREAARRAAAAAAEAQRLKDMQAATAGAKAASGAQVERPTKAVQQAPARFDVDTLTTAYGLKGDESKALLSAFDANGSKALDYAEFDALFASIHNPTKPFTVPALTPDAIPPHQVMLHTEAGIAADGPGQLLNMMSGKHLEESRYADGLEEPQATGVDYTLYTNSDDEPRLKATGVTDVPAPDAMGGKWDPTTFAPHYVFAEGEDAFPVRPDYDGNADLDDNGSKTLEGTEADGYRDGVIDEQQALNGGFVVSQKGEYTVLTYSNFYATNKTENYHDKDYSTAQVYLKPNEKGELEPAFLATSWHTGAQMTPWKDVKKDAQGHPVIGVGKGSHSLQPIGAHQAIPADGLHIQGDGTATKDGQSIGHRMAYDALQTNVKNAHLIEPGSNRAEARLGTLGWGSTAADPLLPEAFSEDNTANEVKARLHGDIDKLLANVEDPAERQAALLAVLDGASRTGVTGSQEYFDGLQRGLEGIDVDNLTPRGRGEMSTLAALFEKRGTAHSDMRAQALRLMADSEFPVEVARHLTYALQNGDDNAKNIADAHAALPEGTAPESPEAIAIRLVTDAISPQEGDDFADDIRDERG